MSFKKCIAGVIAFCMVKWCIAVFPLSILSMNNEILVRPTKLEMELNGELLVMQTFVKPHDVVFDVGAHCGSYTRALLSLKRPLKIYAFEPVHASFALLVFNMKTGSSLVAPSNFVPSVDWDFFKKIAASCSKSYEVVTFDQASRVEMFESAIGNCIGKVDFYEYPDVIGLSSFYLREVLKNECKFEKSEVDCITLDRFCYVNNLSHVHFIKVDTEGAELDVLYGARDMLTKHAIDFIQFEYGGCYIDAKTTLKQAYDYLTLLGYAICKIYPDGLVYIDKWDHSLENYVFCNYFACRRELFSEFSLKKECEN